MPLWPRRKVLPQDDSQPDRCTLVSMLRARTRIRGRPGLLELPYEARLERQSKWKQKGLKSDRTGIGPRREARKNELHDSDTHGPLHTNGGTASFPLAPQVNSDCDETSTENKERAGVDR